MDFTQIYNEERRFNNQLHSPDLFTNRELSWMEFNKRVLFQSMRPEIPLLERLKFLGITESNLDEFIMVRLSSIMNKIRAGSQIPELSGMLPEQEYRLLFDEIIKFKEIQQDSFMKLHRKLVKQNIEIVDISDLNDEEYLEAQRLFERSIYPLITPITFDTTKDFPLIKSKQLCIIVELEDLKSVNGNVVSIIPLDGGMERLYRIKAKGQTAERYVLLEDLVQAFLHKIFINKPTVYAGTMRIVREADVEMDQDQDVMIVDRMRETLIRRAFSQPIFMDIIHDAPKHIVKLLTRIFELDKSHVFKCPYIVDMTFLAGKPIRNELLEYLPFTPQYPEELVGEQNMFKAIDNNDIVLHHPYESFMPVIHFLQHAAEDENVLAIKQTLYRVSSSESPIVEALCRAAENGKTVNVLLEIKARFDEDRNMSLIEKMKVSGCNLIYGVEGLKTHCKFILVVRKTKKGLKMYSHLGTGNYNDKTASVYTDLSYFTSNNKIGYDLLAIFNVMSSSSFSEPRNEISRIYYAPYNLRTRLYELIDREIEHARAGRDAFITLKLNSLSDKDVIQKLYRASEEGVRIAIFCRGICSMKPINDRIRIKSVIGRYLEHSRIYYFYNNEKTDVYISSADMLTRNLDRRVELLVPIIDEEAQKKVTNILLMYFRDTFNTFTMTRKGRYKIDEVTDDSLNIQEEFMHHAMTNFKYHGLKKITFSKKKG